MKKLFFTAAALSILITQTGCFGSFALVKKIYEFNDSVSDNKVVKTLVMYGLMIIPVYGVCGLLDIVVFNLIEFWKGTNPIAMNEGEVEEQLITIKGEDYKVKATKNQFHFQKIDGNSLVDLGAMVYSETAKKWTFEKGEEVVDLIKFNNNGSFDLIGEDATLSLAITDIDNFEANSCNYTALAAN